MNMDTQDEQDGGRLHGDLTRAVIGCAFEVINELGAGFLESVYEKALALALRQAGLNVEVQRPITVYFRSSVVGEFFADILVERKILVELKAVKVLAPEHQAQIINYLNATGIQIGLLINFGNPRLEYKRFTRSFTNNPPESLSCPSMLNTSSPHDSTVGMNMDIQDKQDGGDCMGSDLGAGFVELNYEKALAPTLRRATKNRPSAPNHYPVHPVHPCSLFPHDPTEIPACSQ